MTVRGNGEIVPGATIYTADDQKLGEVKEVEGLAFKVDAPMELDYWLSSHSIAAAADNRVTLNFDHEHLGVYKMSGPDDEVGAAAAAMADGSVDEPETALSTPEQPLGLSQMEAGAAGTAIRGGVADLHASPTIAGDAAAVETDPTAAGHRESGSAAT